MGRGPWRTSSSAPHSHEAREINHHTKGRKQTCQQTLQDMTDESKPIQKSHILPALLYIQLNISVHVLLFTSRNVKGDARRLLRSHKFVRPCSIFSLLTEVTSSVCCYAICSLMVFAHEGKILLLFLFLKHFVKEKHMKSAIKDIQHMVIKSILAIPKAKGYSHLLSNLLPPHLWKSLTEVHLRKAFPFPSEIQPCCSWQIVSHTD